MHCRRSVVRPLAALLVVGASVLAAAPARGQTTVQVTMPASYLMPNYDRVPIGQQEGLEGGAFIARASGPTATWYNPAGLALAEKSEIAASSTAYEWSRFSVAGTDVKQTNSRLSGLGGAFGVVIGAPPLASDRLRFGFMIVQPITWQPALDVVGAATAGGATDHLSYIAADSINEIVPTLAAAYRISPTLRVGATLGMSFLTLAQNDQLASDVYSAGGLTVAERAIFTDGRVISWVLGGGVQWDVAPNIQVGLTMAAPNLGSGGSTDLIFRRQDSRQTGTTVLTFSDSDARFQYKQPFKLGLGAAWKGSRGDVEFDVKYHATAGTYAVYSSDAKGQSVAGQASGAPVLAEFGLADVIYASHSVTNVAVGGSMRMSDHLTAHGGFFTDRSPVKTSSQVFAPFNLTGFTTGTNVSAGPLSGSVGIAYKWGQRTLDLVGPTGAKLTPDLKISAIDIMFALTYKF